MQCKTQVVVAQGLSGPGCYPGRPHLATVSPPGERNCRDPLSTRVNVRPRRDMQGGRDGLLERRADPQAVAYAASSSLFSQTRRISWISPIDQSAEHVM